MALQTQLHTERLLLRPFHVDDVADAFAYRNDMAVVELGEYGAPPRRCQFLVARKLQERAFVYPGDDLLYRNVVRKHA